MEEQIIPVKSKLKRGGDESSICFPQIPRYFLEFQHTLKFIKKKTGAPPPGLLTVATMLPSDEEKCAVPIIS
jgi:hypothetical protein